MDVLLLEHVPQADGHGIVLRIGTANNFCKNEVHPRSNEGGQDRIDDNRLRQWHGNTGENLPSGCTIDNCCFIDGLRNRIKESFGNVESQSGTSGVYENQCHTNHGTFGKSQRLQDIVHGYHGHKSREQGQNHGHVHVGLTKMEAQT